MSDGIYAALSGAVAAGHALEVTANNLANVNTTGFKKERVSFQEVLAGTDTTQRQVNIEPGGTDMRTGVFKRTDAPLDVAISGPGFFAVQTPEGERYTRAGSFALSPDGTLVTQGGHPVLGASGPIRVDPSTAVTIAADGTVTSNNSEVGQLRVVDFADAAGCEHVGGSLFRANGAAPQTIPTKIENGTVELSNVNAVESMTELIMISRSYEHFTKAIQNHSEIDRLTVTELGR
jgi:flagellar basal-body rod protein FlgF